MNWAQKGQEEIHICAHCEEPMSLHWLFGATCGGCLTQDSVRVVWDWEKEEIVERL